MCTGILVRVLDICLYCPPYCLSVLDQLFENTHKTFHSHNFTPSLSLSLDGESVRLATVLQENAVLKSEMEMLKLKCKNLTEENKRLRQASVNIVS